MTHDLGIKNTLILVHGMETSTGDQLLEAPLLKGLTQRAAESSGCPIQTWGNYHLGCCYTRAGTPPSTCIRLERPAARIACITYVFRCPKPRKYHCETVFCYVCNFFDHLGSKIEPRGYQKSSNHKNTPGMGWNAPDLYTAQFLAQSDKIPRN